MHKIFIYIDGSQFDVVEDKLITINMLMLDAKEVIITPVLLEPDNELAYDVNITTQ